MGKLGHLIYITEGYPPTPGAVSVISDGWVKYLRKEGWKVSVVAPIYSDESAQSSDPEVYFISIPRPSSFPSRISYLIQKNFTPFGRQYLWINPAIKKIQEIHRKYPCNLLLAWSASASHIASQLSPILKIPVALFYWDTWTVNPGLQNFPFYLRWRKSLRNTLARGMERKILATASHIFLHGERLKNLYRQNFQVSSDRVSSVYIGYDPEKIQSLLNVFPRAGPTLTFIYSGSIPSAVSQSIATLSQGLHQMKEEERANFKFHFRVYGQYSSLKANLIHYGLSGSFVLHPGWVSHSESLEEVARNHIAIDLRSTDSFQVPSTKLFIYLGLKKPVLHIGSPESEEAHILQITRAGWSIQPGDKKGLAHLLRELYQKFLHQKPLITPDLTAIQAYSLPVQVRKMSEILQGLLHHQR